MALPSLRSWSPAVAQCTRRASCSTPLAVSVRHKYMPAVPTVEENPLETVEDWTNFQLKRSEYQNLIDHLSKYGSTQNRGNTFQPHHSLQRPPAPNEVTLSALLASGAHFGHSQSLMNPNFMPYAYGVRAGITVIDLDHTLPLLRRAANVVRGVAAKGGSIVFLGTRPDLRAVVRKAVERMGKQAYHVGEKWLPGTLTNKLVVFGAEAVSETRIVPDLVILLNPVPNLRVIRECAIEHIPTIALVDSNVDPRIVMYPIPANDESTRTAELICGLLSIAGREGVALCEEEQARKAKMAERVQRGREKRTDPIDNAYTT